MSITEAVQPFHQKRSSFADMSLNYSADDGGLISWYGKDVKRLERAPVSNKQNLKISQA